MQTNHRVPSDDRRMTEANGERRESRETDPVPDDVPPHSKATATEAPVLRPRKRYRLLKWTGSAFLLFVVVVGIGLAALNGGALDGLLRARVQKALQGALGKDLGATIGDVGVRLASDGRIEMRANGVRIVDQGTHRPVASARSIDIDLSPTALLHGQVDIGSLVVDGVALDPGAFAQGDTSVDLTTLRVDALGGYMKAAFGGADRLLATLDEGHAGTIRVTDTQITPAGANTVPIAIEALTMHRTASGIGLDGTLDVAGKVARVSATAIPNKAQDRIEALKLKLDGLDTTPFLIQTGADGAPAAGVAASLNVSVTAKRGNGKSKPALVAAIAVAPGQLYADGTPAPIHSGHIDLDYDFTKRSIEINDSGFKIGNSSFPFSGGIIDLSNLSKGGERGFAFDLISNDSVSAPSDSDGSSLPFSGKIFAKYFKNRKTLVVNQMAISTPVGALAGSLQVVGGSESPQVSFVATIDRMRTPAIKQLWPYWLAVHAREWVLNNLYGGDITNGSIKLFIPKDEIARNAGNMRFGPNELQINFDYGGARLNIAGDIPPLRNASGHFALEGTKLKIALAGGTAYFPSGRKVDTTDGTFAIPDTDVHPLMADLDIVVSGKAAAVAELVSYDPINALQRTGYKPGDFSGGDVVSHVQATFGLIQQQNPPKPVWKVDATLKNVDLAPPVDGHAFHDLKGTLKVDPAKAVLDTDADIDGFPMHIALTEPFDHDSPIERQRVITARLGNAARKALLPGLNEILDGPVDVRMTRAGQGKQDVTADLSDASVHVPGLGWTKGPGIKATATFSTDDRNDTIAVNDFDLKGDRFSVSGTLNIAGNELAGAHFPTVKLSPLDSFAVDIKRSGNGYAIDLNGHSIDLRGLIEQIKGEGGLSGGGKGVPLQVTAKADLAYGFHQQRLGGLTLSYSGQGERIDSLDARAVTMNGRALVASVESSAGKRDLTLTCGDAGSLALFADIYAKLDGGLLNIRLQASGDGPYRGSLDLRNFSIKNEERLNTIIDGPANRQGRSLRDSAHESINVSTPSFQRAFANLELGGGYLKVSNGVLRGVQIGSSFQGTVYDPKGNMNITGTFMPAYGLNRLFADVPIVGALLGNGRDRGLIGITYKLTGKVSSPRVQVNPLSLIAPGVFRQIFEY